MTWAQEPIERQDLEAVLQVRCELGASYDAALVDSFAERVEAAITPTPSPPAGAAETRRTLARCSSGSESSPSPW